MGFSLLQKIKKLRGLSPNTTTFDQLERPTIDHHPWSILLSATVSSDGLVDYNQFIREKDALASYLTILSENPPGKNWTEEEQLAYWINAYNAFTIQLIIDHFPIASIKDIAGSVPMLNSP